MENAQQANVAVVTGAASGIGEAVARLLVERSWTVVGLDRDETRLSELEVELGHAFLPVVGDVSRRDDHEQARAVATAAGRLNGWVNNAGIERPTTARALDERGTSGPSSTSTWSAPCSAARWPPRRCTTSVARSSTCRASTPWSGSPGPSSTPRPRVASTP